MEMSVAVTGFESGETKLNEETSVMDIQPRFVAAVETRQWNFQVLSFVEERLGSFISDVYGGEATLDLSDKHGGKYYVWSAQDGRKAYALVIDSLIIFGNDESAVERSIGVRNGEVESIRSNPKIPVTADDLASGYIAPDGIAQMANIASIALAKDSSDEAPVQSFVARVLPELLRNSVKEATWRSDLVEGMIVDTFDIALNPELAGVLSETLTPSASAAEPRILKAIPEGRASMTRYDLRDPQIAWRSILLSAQKSTDQTAGGLLLAFSSSLFEPYGIEDPEGFLSAIGPIIYTAKLDLAGDKAIVIATVRDAAKMRASLPRELDLSKAPEKVGNADSWVSEDSDLRLVLDGELMAIGDPFSVITFYQNYSDANAAPSREAAVKIAASNAAAATVLFDPAVYSGIAAAISEAKIEGIPSDISFTETRFNKNGIERRIESDTGMIGRIVAAIVSD
jgi:hypothetical protein